MTRLAAFAAAMFLLGLPALSPTRVLAQPQNPSFNLVNRSGMPIRELYFTPAGDANWGRNRLAGAVIAPGATYPARRRLDGNCIFDIKVVYSDGHAEERRALNTCNVDDVAFGASGAASATRKAPDDPSFRLVNRGSTPLAALYVTPDGRGNWGQNRLNGGALPPQTDRVIHIDRQGTCRFDLRVVFEGGRSLERHHADLCRMTDLPVP